MSIDWDFVRYCVVAALAATFGFVVAVVVVALVLSGIDSLLGPGEPHNTWGDSVEFSSLMTGQERFSEHETNVDGLTIVVDHETGNQYLCTPEGLTGLTDVDGTPLRVWEASDDGED